MSPRFAIDTLTSAHISVFIGIGSPTNSYCFQEIESLHENTNIPRIKQILLLIFRKNLFAFSIATCDAHCSRFVHKSLEMTKKMTYLHALHTQSNCRNVVECIFATESKRERVRLAESRKSQQVSGTKFASKSQKQFSTLSAPTSNANQLGKSTIAMRM